MKIKKYKVVSSTNLIAKKLRPEPWLIILAEKQTVGYGKKLSRWFSPKGGLYFSIVLPKSKIEDLQTLTILAAFIVAKTIRDYYPPPALRSQPTRPKKDILSFEPLIKLPNDVLLNGKKICGILTENIIGKEVKSSVIGIGLNTNIDKFPKELKNEATSLRIELGREVNNEKILKQIVEGIKQQLATISE